MQKLVIATAIALLASQAAMATSPVSTHLPRSHGSGVITSADGALVRPGFDRTAGAETYEADEGFFQKLKSAFR